MLIKESSVQFNRLILIIATNLLLGIDISSLSLISMHTFILYFS
jgi:hypothetical protein